MFGPDLRRRLGIGVIADVGQNARVPCARHRGAVAAAALSRIGAAGGRRLWLLSNQHGGEETHCRNSGQRKDYASHTLLLCYGSVRAINSAGAVRDPVDTAM